MLDTESSIFKLFWTPASEGVTVLGIFYDIVNNDVLVKSNFSLPPVGGEEEEREIAGRDTAVYRPHPGTPPSRGSGF